MSTEYTSVQRLYALRTLRTILLRLGSAALKLCSRLLAQFVNVLTAGARGLTFVMAAYARTYRIILSYSQACQTPRHFPTTTAHRLHLVPCDLSSNKLLTCETGQASLKTV